MGIQWLLERMAGWQDQPALVWHDRPCTYGELLELVASWKESLADLHSVCPGEVVGLRGDYSPNACALLLALIDNRNIIVPFAAAADRMEGFMDTAEVQVLVSFDGRDRYRLRRRPVAVTSPVTLGLIEEEEPGLVLFSSGSTGESKAALHNFSLLLEKYKPTRRRFRTLALLLFDHIGGINTLFYTLSNGGTLVSVAGHDPEVVCEAIENHSVELLPTSPTFLNLLLLSEAYRLHDLSSLELVTYGTEVMPESTLARLHELWPAVRLQQTYGLSELGILRSKSKSSDSLWVKVGGDGFQTKVVDGTLWIRAQSAMVGYLNAPSPFDQEGWLNTQDMVEVEGDYIRILGRDSDIINVGGRKVYPADVESVLLEMEGVLDAAVRPRPHPITGQVVAARVSLSAPEEPGAFKKRMRRFCRGRLDRYQIPMKVELTDQPLHSMRLKKVRR